MRRAGRQSACPGGDRWLSRTRQQPGAQRAYPAQLPDGVSQATIGVRGGLLRSEFEETAEAMFDVGYVYSSAADAEKAFTGEIDRYVPSRYGNPTISMFEERLRLIEGAGGVRDGHRHQPRCSHRLARCLARGPPVAARSLFSAVFVVCNEILPLGCGDGIRRR